MEVLGGPRAGWGGWGGGAQLCMCHSLALPPCSKYCQLPNVFQLTNVFPFLACCSIMLFRRPKGYGTAQQVAVPMQQ